MTRRSANSCSRPRCAWSSARSPTKSSPRPSATSLPPSGRSSARSKVRSPCRRPTRSPASTSRASSLTSTASPEARAPGPEPLLVIYGGKGGVGKTTCASAFALATSAALRRDRSAFALATSAALRRDRSAFALATAAVATSGRVLIVSTDPAHSLGDALGLRLSSAPRRIRRRLDAVELDARRAFARWLRENRRALGDILEHGTWLDATDIDTLLDLSFPGIDELVGLMEIERFAGGGQYDVIVVDTAPTGHTLRLLAAPETVGIVADVLDALQEEHRVIRNQLARVTRGPEAADRLIA